MSSPIYFVEKHQEEFPELIASMLEAIPRWKCRASTRWVNEEPCLDALDKWTMRYGYYLEPLYLSREHSWGYNIYRNGKKIDSRRGLHSKSNVYAKGLKYILTAISKEELFK